MTTSIPRTFDKWAVLDDIGWNPHPGQLLVAESQARHRVVAAGRRFGKSDVGGHELVPEALFTYAMRDELAQQMKRREFWIVGPEYSDSEKEFRVVYNELRRLGVPFDKPGTYNSPLDGNMHISLWDGAFQIHAKSAKYPDQLVGEGLSGVIMAEAAKMKERVWVKYIRPTLSDFGGWSLHTSTPEGKNHFYEMYQWGRDPGRTDWDSWRMPAWVNSYVYKFRTKAADVKRLQQLMQHEMLTQDLGERALDDEKYGSNRLQALCLKYGLDVDPEILDLMDSMTVEAFNQEIGADFTEFVGRVFKQFDEETHVADLPYNPNWETYAAVDYGFTNPNVWLLIQVGPHGEINVINEFYQPGLTADEFAYAVAERGLVPPGIKRFYPDPASPGDSEIMARILRVDIGQHTGGELTFRIDAIRKALKDESAKHMPFGHPDRRPQLMFDRKCKMCIHEFLEYRYPEKKEQSSTPSQELPMKKDDHTPEALGRFFRGHFGTPQEAVRSTKIQKGKYRR